MTEDHGPPSPTLGLWPLTPGVMVEISLTADQRTGDVFSDIRKEVTAGLMQILGLMEVDQRCIHIIDKGLDTATDVHNFAAAFHPDPTCPAEMRGGVVDGTQVDAQRLDHNERGIPRERVQVPVQQAGTADYELVGFRSDPPVWVYDAAR
jgi:hypothetical protein